jgi:hypothetical protein
MTNIPRRAWFQIHLSTAIVMMFVAGIFMWMNFKPRFIRTSQAKAISFFGEYDSGFLEYGWPTPARRFFAKFSILKYEDFKNHYSNKTEYDEALQSEINNGYVIRVGDGFAYDRMIMGYIQNGVILNAFSAIIILVSVALSWEILIRRRRRSCQLG